MIVIAELENAIRKHTTNLEKQLQRYCAYNEIIFSDIPKRLAGVRTFSPTEPREIMDIKTGKTILRDQMNFVNTENGGLKVVFTIECLWERTS